MLNRGSALTPAIDNEAIHFSRGKKPTCNCIDSLKLDDSSAHIVFGARKFDTQACLEYVRGRFLAPRLLGATILVSRSVSF